METIDVTKLTEEQRKELLKQLQQDETDIRRARREAYEMSKAAFMESVFGMVDEQKAALDKFNSDLVEGIKDFRKVMEKYGQMRDDQLSFTLIWNDNKLIVKTNKVKRFDERADMAAARLIDFLKAYIKRTDNGQNDPLYQLAMKMIERNRQGDLDYKQVSNLYELEGRFNDPEYTAIMELFRESHIIEGTATHFYFFRKSENGFWRKIELSFNQL